MGRTAEAVTLTYHVSGQEQDEFAAVSQLRATDETARRAFAEEITPVKTGFRRQTTVSVDELPGPT
jgi:acetyl-CoA C-acetyltransferase